MGGYALKLAKQMAAVLGSDEHMVAAARCLPKGATTRRALGAAVGTVGGLVPAAVGSLAGGATTAGQAPGGIPLPRNLALGLTDQRLLVFSLSQATERAIGCTHAIPLFDVHTARHEIGRKLMTRVARLDVALSDGSTIAVEAPSPRSREAQRFAEALETVVAPLPRRERAADRGW